MKFKFLVISCLALSMTFLTSCEKEEEETGTTTSSTTASTTSSTTATTTSTTSGSTTESTTSGSTTSSTTSGTTTSSTTSGSTTESTTSGSTTSSTTSSTTGSTTGTAAAGSIVATFDGSEKTFKSPSFYYGGGSYSILGSTSDYSYSIILRLTTETEGNFIEGNTYTLSTKQGSIQVGTSSPKILFETDSSNTGRLIITKHDKTAKTISGTFSFNAKSTISEDVKEIKSGSFTDIKY